MPLVEGFEEEKRDDGGEYDRPGRAPILSAVYADAAVMTMQPTTPMAMPRAVSCPLGRFMSSFAYIRSPSSGKSGYRTDAKQYSSSA